MTTSGEAAALSPPVSARDHVQGSADAPITLVEYGDFECSHCGRAHPIVKTIQKHFGKRLRFVFRNFPLTTIHPHAEHAAEAAEAAAAHGRFWEMHDVLYEHQRALEDDQLGSYAKAIGLDRGRVLSDLRDGTYAGKVRADFLSGVRSGVNGTPTFFINGRRHDASWDTAGLTDALEAELAPR